MSYQPRITRKNLDQIAELAFNIWSARLYEAYRIADSCDVMAADFDIRRLVWGSLSRPDGGTEQVAQAAHKVLGDDKYQALCADQWARLEAAAKHRWAVTCRLLYRTGVSETIARYVADTRATIA